MSPGLSFDDSSVTVLPHVPPTPHDRGCRRTRRPPPRRRLHPEELRTWQAAQQAAAAQIDPVWDRLAQCESGGRWSIDSRYDGGLQFHPDTWRAYGGTEFATDAHQATREQQIAVAERVQDDAGWGAWPACSRQLGLR